MKIFVSLIKTRAMDKIFKSQQAMAWIALLTFMAVAVLLVDSYRTKKTLAFLLKTA